MNTSTATLFFKNYKKYFLNRFKPCKKLWPNQLCFKIGQSLGCFVKLSYNGRSVFAHLTQPCAWSGHGTTVRRPSQCAKSWGPIRGSRRAAEEEICQRSVARKESDGLVSCLIWFSLDSGRQQFIWNMSFWILRIRNPQILRIKIKCFAVEKEFSWRSFPSYSKTLRYHNLLVMVRLWQACNFDWTNTQ